MGRRRFAVVLLLPAALSAEVDALRRACGDPALDRVPPHITLVPPVNVPDTAVGAVVELLASVAAAHDPLSLTLGPVATFLPDTPTAHLVVGGDLEELAALRDGLDAGPLARTRSWPFVPHVTLTEMTDPSRLAAIVTALADYRAEAVVGGVHLMEHLERDRTRRWWPVHSERFGRPVVIRAGAVEVRLVELEIGARDLVVVRALRGARIVGETTATLPQGRPARLHAMWVDEPATGVGSAMLRTLVDAARDRGCPSVVAHADAPLHELLVRRGFTPLDGGELLERRL